MAVTPLKWSDGLAITLSCLAGIMAFAFLWMEKTPVWAVTTIAGMAVFVIYPVFRLWHSWKARTTVIAVCWLGIAGFGWRIWPQEKAPVDRNSAREIDQNTDSKEKDSVPHLTAYLTLEPAW